MSQALAPARAAGQAPSALAQALLRELADMLAALASDPGCEAVIDLRSLPMEESDREALRDWLGRGEIEANCDVAGVSRVQETGFAGVWWVSHYGLGGVALVEQIVVARVPALLLAHPCDIRAAQERLTQCLAQVGCAARETHLR